MERTSHVPDELLDLVVIGGGPGGYSAAYRAADLGMNVAIVERYATLGGVCLNVGCIPSKALLHVAGVKEEVEKIAERGIHFGPAKVNLNALRAFKDGTVKILTDGLSRMAGARNVRIVSGVAKFVSTHRLEISQPDGTVRHIEFRKCIIATGSSAIKLDAFPKDGRIVTSTGALKLDRIPRRMLIIGAGIIGLEMATVYSALGAQIDLVERLPHILPGVDPDAVKIWKSRNIHRFGCIDLNASVRSAQAKSDGVAVEIQGTETVTRSYDLVLQSVGRAPNSSNLGFEIAGVERDAKGFVVVNKKMQTNIPHIFAIGDVAGAPMLAHKAVHEGHVAAEVAAELKASFDAKLVPNVAYTNPEIAWVGAMEHDAPASPVQRLVSAKFPWAASGRAVASDASYGMTKLIFDDESRRIVGGVIVGPHAGDMIGEVCLAIEMGADAIDIGKTIHPHPTLGETIGIAAEVYENVCTDLMPSTKTKPGRVSHE
jgi:dihydrolipoamide dehydrogenase